MNGSAGVDDCDDALPLPGGSGCGLTWDEHHAANTGHLDRRDFDGDVDAAVDLAQAIEAALEPLAEAGVTPTVEEVEDVLSSFHPYTEVADDAARTVGTAFGVPVDGGCVFGQIYEGELSVEIGGPTSDGPCLGYYGH